MAVFIVAEIGVNHDGSIEIAKKLVRSAYLAGADVVKFQLWSVNQFPKIEHLRLSPVQLYEAIQYAEELGIKWFCTPFDLDSINILHNWDMAVWKIQSGYLQNEQHINAIAEICPKEIIISTGKGNQEKLPTIKEINHCIAKFMDYSKVTLLYCVSSYPTLPQDIFLPSITTMRTLFPQVSYGLSHS